jgi:hypothetical protein
LKRSRESSVTRFGDSRRGEKEGNEPKIREVWVKELRGFWDAPSCGNLRGCRGWTRSGRVEKGPAITEGNVDYSAVYLQTQNQSDFSYSSERRDWASLVYLIDRFGMW